MEVVLIIIVVIFFLLWLLKKLFITSDKVWNIAKNNGVKKTTSSTNNCKKCLNAGHIMHTNEINCSIKDIEVTENMVCSEFKEIGNLKNSFFGS